MPPQRGVLSLADLSSVREVYSFGRERGYCQKGVFIWRGGKGEYCWRGVFVWKGRRGRRGYCQSVAHVEVRRQPAEGIQPFDGAGGVSHVLSVQQNQLLLHSHGNGFHLLPDLTHGGRRPFLRQTYQQNAVRLAPGNQSETHKWRKKGGKMVENVTTCTCIYSNMQIHVYFSCPLSLWI